MHIISQNLKKKERLGDPGIDEGIILNWTLCRVN
jgi:hypothetical protein